MGVWDMDGNGPGIVKIIDCTYFFKSRCNKLTDYVNARTDLI